MKNVPNMAVANTNSLKTQYGFFFFGGGRESTDPDHLLVITAVLSISVLIHFFHPFPTLPNTAKANTINGPPQGPKGWQFLSVIEKFKSL